MAKDFCGSLGYLAPEIYKGEEYRYEVDMFALGVILVRLLSGVRPFSSHNKEKLRRDTINLSYSVQGRNWEDISPDALKLVRKLLIGRDQRLTASEAIKHDWLQADQQGDSILRPDFSQSRQYHANQDNYSQVVVEVCWTILRNVYRMDCICDLYS